MVRRAVGSSGRLAMKNAELVSQVIRGPQGIHLGGCLPESNVRALYSVNSLIFMVIKVYISNRF